MQTRFASPSRATALCGVFFVAMAAPSFAEDEEDGHRDAREQIRAAIESYAAAFNARDVGQLAAHWSPDGVYVSRTSGDRVVGRPAIAKGFEAIFAGGQAPQLRVETESIEFISPNVAVERGTATSTTPAGDVEKSAYSVVFLKIEGQWLIDRVTEDAFNDLSPRQEQLKRLEWMIGSWIDDDEDVVIESECQWTKNENFISRKYAVSNQGEVEHSGLQIIGWDPQQEQIRSWLFDSSGGMVQGTWTQREDRWVVNSVASLPDGGRGSFTSIFRPLDGDRIAWKKINRVIDGELMPNLEETIIRRR